jgi:hypothetical protein
MSYFNPPKQSNEENKSKESISKIFTDETNLPKKRRSKTKQDRSPITTDNHFLSSVQVEKTSFILFDEVGFKS